MKFVRETEILTENLKMKEEANEYSGVVCIKHNDDILFSSTHGYANRTWNVKTNWILSSELAQYRRCLQRLRY